MIMRKHLTYLIVALAALSANAQRWQSRQLNDQERIQAVLQEMTMEEKISLLGFGGIPRLGIKAPGGSEAIHGLVVGGPAWGDRSADVKQVTTSFPQGYGLGETWDTALVQQIGHQMGIEARAINQRSGYRSQAGLVLWAPNADIARDPRWGRTEEAFGEDPFLVGELSAAMVRGLQGPRHDYWLTASLMKHFLANSNETERTSTSSDFPEKQWREYYSAGFKSGFDAGASSFMAAYNKYNGVPCTVHPMLQDILAQEWGVDGIYSTDGGAFRLLLSDHHYFDSLPEAAAACIKSGINQFLDQFAPAARQALQDGLLTEEQIDKALEGKLRVMLRLGLLDNPLDTANPYANIGVTENFEPWSTQQAHDLARKAAQKSIVLLKNEKSLLPLDAKRIKRIAVIGNRADSVLPDWYSGMPPYAISPLKGIRHYADSLGFEVRYVTDDRSGHAAEAARWADAVIVCVGNNPTMATDYETVPPWGAGSNLGEGREALDRRSLQLDSEDLIRVARKHNPNTIVALISSFPYSINWTAENVDAILHCAQSGQELGSALAAAIFGEVNPAGRLTQTWPRAIDDLPDILDYDITHGRTYMYAQPTPLFPFGYGLSYSQFQYSNLYVEEDEDCLVARVDVTNKSNRDGEEVVQAYVTIPDDDAYQRLKGFNRVSIPAKSTSTVEIKMPFSSLMLWDENAHSWNLNPGTYTVAVGPSSASLPLKMDVPLRSK